MQHLSTAVMPVAEFLYLSNEYNTHKLCVGNVCQKKRTVRVYVENLTKQRLMVFTDL